MTGASTELGRPSRRVLYLRLGRVSNLPTVWTNVLAGAALARGDADAATLALLGVAASLFYVGGMFLNDAFDREVDARERPERPIPAGHVTAREVFGVGFGLLTGGLALIAWNSTLHPRGAAGSVVAGAALAGLVVLYDAWHKQNPLSPVVMGLCRSAVYVTAGLGAGGLWGRSLVAGALVVGAYVVGLTFVARQENRRSFRAGATLGLLGAPLAFALAAPKMGAPGWGMAVLVAAWVVATVAPLFREGPVNVPRAVVRLIAGISLVDGLLAAAYGQPALAPLAVVGFGATLLLQRWVRGT